MGRNTSGENGEGPSGPGAGNHGGWGSGGGYGNGGGNGGSGSNGSNASNGSAAGSSSNSGRRGSAAGAFGSVGSAIGDAVGGLADGIGGLAEGVSNAANSALGALGFGSPDKGGIDGTGVGWKGSGHESRAEAAYGQVEQGFDARSAVNVGRNVPGIGGLLGLAGDLAAKSMSPTAQTAYNNMKDQGVSTLASSVGKLAGQYAMPGAPVGQFMTMADAGLEQGYADSLMGRTTSDRRSTANTAFAGSNGGGGYSSSGNQLVGITSGGYGNQLVGITGEMPTMAMPDYDSFDYTSHLDKFQRS